MSLPSMLIDYFSRLRSVEVAVPHTNPTLQKCAWFHSVAYRCFLVFLTYDSLVVHLQLFIPRSLR